MNKHEMMEKKTFDEVKYEEKFILKVLK